MKTPVNVIKVFLLALALLVVGVVLIGCDVFANNTGPDDLPCPPPQAQPPTNLSNITCPDIMKRGHCTDCMFAKGRGWYCSVCSDGYHANNISLCHPLELSCVKYCDDKVQKTPPKPSKVQGNNGVPWPTMCLDTHVSNFFGIGDWGGIFGWDGEVGEKSKKSKLCTHWYGKANVAPGMPCPMPNNRQALGPLPFQQAAPVEAIVQKKVSDRMTERAQKLKEAGTPIQFIINVGDNFYPGGINVHCGTNHSGIVQKQFEQVWHNVYGDLTKEFEWWSVLGNHDYGGECYIKGWDQQIWYTYNQANWLMPGQYWRRSVQYKNFKVDFFFLDTNWYDVTESSGAPANHDICNKEMNTNTGSGNQVCSRTHYPPNPGIAWTDSCDGVDGLYSIPGGPSQSKCPKWFDDLWNMQYKWLMKSMRASTHGIMKADWQIIVSHYPSTYSMGGSPTTPNSLVRWEHWMPAMGVDLAITGHDHQQQIFAGDWGSIEKGGKGVWLTPYVITGGGGGVTSQQTASLDGTDNGYGFMEFEMTLQDLTIKTWSHGGVRNEHILINWTVVQPVQAKSDDEIIRLGLDPQNLLQRGEKEFTV